MCVHVPQHRPSDPGQIARLHYETVRRVNVAEWDGCIARFTEFDPNGHIDCFYAHHDWQRCGVGRALMNHVHVEARAAGIARLHADVSLTAHRFFSAMGFQVVREQIRRCRGRAFRQFLMEKHLSSIGTSAES